MEFSTRMESASARIRNAADDQFSAVKVRLANLVREPEVRDVENPFRPMIFLRAIYLGLERVGINEPDLLRTTKAVRLRIGRADRRRLCRGRPPPCRAGDQRRHDACGSDTPFGAPRAADPVHELGPERGIRTRRTPVHPTRFRLRPAGSSPPASRSTRCCMPCIRACNWSCAVAARCCGRFIGQAMFRAAKPGVRRFRGGRCRGAVSMARERRRPCRAARTVSIANCSPRSRGAAQWAPAASWPCAARSAIPPPLRSIQRCSGLRSPTSGEAGRQADDRNRRPSFRAHRSCGLVPSPIKEQLLPPAISDDPRGAHRPDLFVSPQQPARELLDRIAGTSIGWVPKGEHNERYLDEVRARGHHVLEATDEGLAPFQQALRQFEDYLRQRTRATTIRSARAKRALEEAETREVMAINAPSRSGRVRRRHAGVVPARFSARELGARARRGQPARVRQPGLMRHYLKLVPALVGRCSESGPGGQAAPGAQGPAGVERVARGLALMNGRSRKRRSSSRGC